MIKFTRFSNVRAAGDWEWTVILGRLQIRIGRSQSAIWWMKRRYEFATLVNLLYGHARPR